MANQLVAALGAAAVLLSGARALLAGTRQRTRRRAPGGKDAQAKERAREDAYACALPRQITPTADARGRGGAQAGDGNGDGTAPRDRVHVCMSTPVVGVDATDSVESAISLMRKKGVSSVLVTCEHCMPGIITQSDVQSKVLDASKTPSDVEAGEIMTCPVLTIAEDASVFQCAYLLDALGIRRFFVTATKNRYKMAGVVSYNDLLSRWHGTEEELVEGATRVAEEAALAEAEAEAELLSSGSDGTRRVLNSGGSASSRGSAAAGSSGGGGRGASQTSHGAPGGANAGERDLRASDTLTRLEGIASGASLAILSEDVEVVGRIGRGGFGEVMRGKWKGTDVALKKLWLDEAGEIDVSAFEREAAVLASLRHPNVVLFMGVCLQPPDVSLVMEYCPRGSLDKLLHSKGGVPLNTRQRLRLAVQAARGMTFLHEHDPPIIHRDLKPANLLVTSDMSVKVCDFGLSRILKADRVSAASRGSVGTPHYAAPEVLRGEAYDHTVDAFAFGICLWEIMENQRPFSNMDPVQVAAAIAFGSAPPMLVLSEGADPRLQSLIDRCVNVNPKARPAFREILNVLAEVYEATPLMPKEHTSPPRTPSLGSGRAVLQVPPRVSPSVSRDSEPEHGAMPPR